MATNPDDIHLTEEERRCLAILADKRGASWIEVVQELLGSAEATLGIERGLASAARGEGVSAEHVHKRIRRMRDFPTS